MPVTEEQRLRAEANRLAALAKRKSFTEFTVDQGPQHHPCQLFKCQKLSTGARSTTQYPTTPPNVPNASNSNTLLAQKFQARLEISSPDSFSITPGALQGFLYPGHEECLQILHFRLSDVEASHYTQNQGGGRACVYNLRDYDAVLLCLKNYKDIEIQDIPFGTLNVVQRFSNSFGTGRWEPFRPEHLCDGKVDELISKLPRKMLDRLLPFQLDGLRFGLRRGGRCLIADEMGLGKTLQAIAIAGCFIDEGPILVVCPAILRYTWAEELEQWLPSCLPSDIHLVFGHLDNPTYLTKWPRVVVISYKMFHHLRKSMLEREWALLIVDESHHLRCSKKMSEPNEVKAVIDVAAKVKRIVLLSGTPSLSRPYDIFHQVDILWPGLLGRTKYDFAKTYCAIRSVKTSEGKCFQDFSRGVRLEELNVLLRQTVMIRRLKKHVMKQLPPIRRQIIRLSLKRSDILLAKAAVRRVEKTEALTSEKVLAKATVEVKNDDATTSDIVSAEAAVEVKTDDATKSDIVSVKATVELKDDASGESGTKSSELSYQELGIAKLPAFREWFLIHPLFAESDDIEELDVDPNSKKMIIFAHHHKVLDGVQELACEKGIGFVRIDGKTLARDRQSAVLNFQSSNEVKIAIIGVQAGGVGLDFSSARNVVFLELPQSSELMRQAESRAHRRGQTNAVNVYIFCAKDTMDERHWRYLNRSLHCVSSTMNGKYDAEPEIAVDEVSSLEATIEARGSSDDKALEKASCEELPSLCASISAEETQLFKSQDNATNTLTDRSNEFSGSSPSSVHDCIFELEQDSEDLGEELYNHIIASENLERNISDEIGGVSSSWLDKGKEGEDQLPNEQNICSQTKEADSLAVMEDEADQTFSNEVYSLRFEVSKYTGRIHLYSCIMGTDSRPQPLFENFRLEELESRNCPTLVGRPAYSHALHAFVDEWNKLRPIEKRKLMGKTLQLPLSIELCILGENVKHNAEGLLKGGSKRRMTPWSEISYDLPPNSVWKKVKLSSSYGKQEKQFAQGWTLTNEPLCKLCQSQCKGSNAKVPAFFEDLFCKLSCYEEYRMRTSSRFLRQELFQIEHGICSNCQLDCHQLVENIKPLSPKKRRAYIEKVAPNVANRKRLINKLVESPSEGNAWHADHIVAVYRGGGECRLENMRTLCVACHYDVTAAQRAERKISRAKAKQQLKIIMNDLKNGRSIADSDSNFKDKENKEIEEEDELLISVKVPGSAYSSAGKDIIDPSSKDLNNISNAEEKCTEIVQ
ncbi:SWI/SNF-related matrix-associated actin-dependent regulator of chromatin subfamily A-like protein 1 [Euphorbia peplus]|nr:SWI/SNF-related matrix-associated actin-dependent regulator of chromatin subfamily A-like protein 1 [Euphorbia peplus]